MKKLNSYILVLATSLVLFILGLGTFYFLEEKTSDNFLQEISFASSISLSATNPDSIKELSEIIPNDISQTASYIRLKEQIVKIGNDFSGKGIDAIYFLTKKDDQIHFIAESTPEGDPLYVAPGKLYEQPPVEIFNVFNDKRDFFSELYTDEYGTYISKFTPFFNNEGEFIGVLGVDVDYTYYQQQLYKLKIIFWCSWLLLCIFINLVIFYLIKSHKLKKNTIISEQKILAISNSIADGIVVINSESKIIFWNKTSEQFFGYSFTEALDLKFNDLVKIESLKNTDNGEEFSVKELSLDSPFINNILEVKLKKDKKNKKYYELRFSMVEINEENNLVCVFHDISHRKDEESRLQQQKSELEALNTLMIGRELKMIDLKKKILELKNSNQKD